MGCAVPLTPCTVDKFPFSEAAGRREIQSEKLDLESSEHLKEQEVGATPSAHIAAYLWPYCTGQSHHALHSVSMCARFSVHYLKRKIIRDISLYSFCF